MTTGLIWSAVIVYLIAGLAVAFLSRGKTTNGAGVDMSGYFLGNRQMKGFVSALSYSATTYSAFMMVGLAGLTYAGGVGAFGFENHVEGVAAVESLAHGHEAGSYRVVDRKILDDLGVDPNLARRQKGKYQGTPPKKHHRPAMFEGEVGEAPGKKLDPPCRPVGML